MGECVIYKNKGIILLEPYYDKTNFEHIMESDLWSFVMTIALKLKFMICNVTEINKDQDY